MRELGLRFGSSFTDMNWTVNQYDLFGWCCDTCFAGPFMRAVEQRRGLVLGKESFRPSDDFFFIVLAFYSKESAYRLKNVLMTMCLRFRVGW